MIPEIRGGGGGGVHRFSVDYLLQNGTARTSRDPPWIFLSARLAMDKALSLAQQFRTKFGTDARLYRAPGRVNLIGEHTDYNDGYVMPAAIDFDCWVAAAPRIDHKLVIHSENLQQTFEFDLSLESPRPSQTWHDYAVGVAVELNRAGCRIRGATLLIRGEVPLGSGLSSSAAIEVATACAMLDISGGSMDRVQLARICQKAENEFVGARCGIMDQFVSLHGRAGHSLMLDCRSLDYELIPIPKSVKLVICNTMVKHELASNEYNRRRAECEEAVNRLSAALPGIRALRDVNSEQLERYRSLLPETVWRRAYHIVWENARVLQAAAALRSGDLSEFGKAMAESHRSLRDFYEVSCPELDLLVELATRQKSNYGARMTGGGFGGCTINLVESEHAEEFRREITEAYEEATGLRPETYVSSAADGASAVILPNRAGTAGAAPQLKCVKP
jgi:galactokinase